MSENAALDTDSIGSNNRLAYAVPPEYQGSTSPWVRISNLDIDIIARRNFEACVKFNRGLAIEIVIGTVDVVSVRGANVNVALVKLAMGGGGFGEKRRSLRRFAAVTTCFPGAR